VTYNNEIKYNELWDMMPCNASRGSNSRLFFSPEEGGSSLLRRVHNSPLRYTVSHAEHCDLHRRYRESVKSRNSDMVFILLLLLLDTVKVTFG
jgi:hypothetical protein